MTLLFSPSFLTTVDISADAVPPETDSAPVGPGGTFSFDFEVDAAATAGTVRFTVTCNSAFTISLPPPAAPIVIPGIPEEDTVALQIAPAAPVPAPAPAAAPAPLPLSFDVFGPAVPVSGVPRFTG